MKALVLAGGVPQAELLKQLKARKIETVLLDGSENAVARPYADQFICLNIFDVEKVKETAIEQKADFILTVCADQVLLIAAQVSEMLGLPCYIDYQTAVAVSDKLCMKKILKKYGIPTTDYVELDRLTPEGIRGLRYPLVVKPVDAYSSKGVRKAGNYQELEQFYKEAETISRSGRVIVEEFFEGQEISVDAFVVDGTAKVLAVTNSEKVADKDRFVIFRGRYPAKVNEAVLKKIEDVAQKVAEGFGLRNAPLLIQLLEKNGELSVLELCARTGGNMKYLLIRYSSGVDVIRATIDITLGKKPGLDATERTYPVVVNDFIYCRPGILDHFEGFDEMVRAGFINEFHAVRRKGTEMKGVRCSSDRVAGMNIVADSIDEMNRKRAQILQSVKVIDEEGRNMMRYDLLPDLE